jgi:ceramide glucosyltransferase
VLAAVALGASALAYMAVAAWCVGRFARRARPATGFAPPVTVLKPLYGAEPELYESLRGFFAQDYPDYQILFGLAGPDDPARAVAARLIAEFPERDAEIVTAARVAGRNPKISNLINMLPAARHGFLVISDADIAVTPDYLARVAAPFADPAVGAVTCPYTARAARPGLAASLACQHINDWFLPSVLVARALGQVNFCMGSTMAARSDALTAIGGLAALKDELADDYMLGRRLVARGYRVVLADRLVETVVSETEMSAVASRELRWARTIRGVEPAKYVASCLEHTISMTALAGLVLLLAGAGGAGAAMLAAGIAARLALHAYVHSRLAIPEMRFALVPLRDVLSFCIWAASFFGRAVVWRDRTLTTDRSGTLIDTQQRAP